MSSNRRNQNSDRRVSVMPRAGMPSFQDHVERGYAVRRDQDDLVVGSVIDLADLAAFDVVEPESREISRSAFAMGREST